MANIDFKSPALQKLSLAILLASGALGVFYFTHLLPFGFPNNREHVATLRAEFEKKNSELARARASVADLPRFEAEYEQLHQRWQLAAELLPTDRQFSTLLRKITLAGEQTGVQFVMFKPNGSKPSEYHTELPVQISVTGPYHNIGSFLAELANMRRIVTVNSLHLASNTKSDEGSTTAEFIASAYSLNTTPVSTTPGTTPPAAKKEEAHGK
jgi:type IV pilus assembly protein PilO